MINKAESPAASDDWHCGGWAGAEMATFQHMMSLTFEQKIAWLEGAQETVAAMHGWEAARQNSGTTVKPRLGAA